MKVAVTGSAGLVGGSVVEHFAVRGHDVLGIDNNMRATWFGPAGDTRLVATLLRERHQRYHHVEADVRDGPTIGRLVDDFQPDLVVHAAGQPSHDLSASLPRVDFEVNVAGTISVLEAVREHAPAAALVFLSSNKVYGDAPNELPFLEMPTRFDYSRAEDHAGISESMRLDRSTHTIFGASKLAADVLVQEYGRSFGLATVCLRAGCLTGEHHAGVPLHGFLSHLVRTAVAGNRYEVIGFGGKQVRDNLHGSDVAGFCELFVERPRAGAVYNIGGGRENSCSVLEATDAIGLVLGRPMELDFNDQARLGDHRCYITDLTSIRSDYPDWSVNVSLESIYEELASTWRQRLDS